MAGQDSKIEIWLKENYEDQSFVDDEFARLAEKIMDEPYNNAGE